MSAVKSLIPGWMSAIVAVSGCAHEAFSPPAGWAVSEGPAPLREGEARLGLAFGGGGVGLGGELVGGHVRYRQGLGGEMPHEFGVTAAALVLTEDSRSDVFPAVFSMKGDFRSAFSSEFPHGSWSAGFGAGASAAGWFVSPELGASLGYENPYAVPWLKVGGYLSVPLGAREVDLARAEDSEPIFDKPLLTFGGRFAVGLTVQLPWFDLFIVAETARMIDVEGKDEAASVLNLGLDFEL